MADERQAIRSLLIPLVRGTLLVPGTVVAEIIPYAGHVPLDRAPNWLLGRLTWRGLVLPLIAFEVASGLLPELSEVADRRVAVFNGLGGNPALPFFALLIQGVPRMIHVGPETVASMEHEADQPLMARYVEVAGQAAVIPDMDKLEAMVLEAVPDLPWQSAEVQSR